MLYYVRYKLSADKLSDLADAVHSGGFPFKAQYVFTSREDPHEGFTIWDVEDSNKLKKIITQLERYAEIREVIPVVSAEEAQERLFQKLSES